ncbi:hypothetical protein KR074_001266 [Drosophila pseudoananassae]|nr:hypothetical protein KR074_001266 [Drosophila pseudoananassae]
MYTDFDEIKLTNDDLPFENIYDNDDPYVPTYKPGSPSSTSKNTVPATAKTKTQTSHKIPPYPHSSYLKDGNRIYEFSRTNGDREKMELWKEAYNIFYSNHVVTENVEKEKVKDTVLTIILPCLHRIKGPVDPDTDIKCPQCKKPIHTTKVLPNL